MNRRLPQLALTAGLALLLAGCATEVGLHTFIKQTHPPKPDTASVEVFTNGVPTRAFEQVAILDAHCESQGFMTPNLKSDGLPMLLKQARLAGCDAIIEVEEAPVPDNWTFETKVKHYTAVGIVYK